MHLRSTIAKAEDITEEMIVNEDGLQEEDLNENILLQCFGLINGDLVSLALLIAQ